MTQTVTLSVDNMTCASCVLRVEKVLTRQPGVQSASVNLAAETAQVATDGPVEPLLAALAKAGYPAAPKVDRAAKAAAKAEEAATLRQHLIIAAVLTLPVFLVEMGGHIYMPLHHWIAGTIGLQVLWLIEFVLATVVLAWPGRVFFAHGLPALWQRAPEMNSLVAMGSGAAYLYSAVATLFPTVLPPESRVVYFEAAMVIVTLILLGRLLEARAKGRAGAAIQALIGLRPDTADVLRNGVPVNIPLAQVVPGDLVLLRPGARIPVDGVLTEGQGHVDESMITGEPMPVEKSPGAPLIGGTLNGASALTMTAQAVGEATMLARIVRMVETAQGVKLPIQAQVDRVTAIFVPAVMTVALMTFLAWLVLGPSLAHAVVAGVAVLIIACPCAMGLATPTSIMVGTGRAAELGLLVRKGEALERLSTIRTLAFDKTGTLTEGRPTLTTFTGLTDDALSLVAAVEQASEHPLARAIVAAHDGPVPPASGYRAIAGRGAEANVDGTRIIVGSARLMAEENIPLGPLAAEAETLAARGETPFFAARDGQPLALLGVSDPLRSEAPAVIAALKSTGHRVAMITGDNATTARAIAARAGIDDVVAGVLPEGKVDSLKSLQADGPVAFIGDGINDAPALATAEVGLAMGGGTDVALETADIVLMRSDMRAVASAIALSRAVMRNIRQNLFWAFAYNAALIPVAAGVLYPAFGITLSPMLGAGAMAFSSVFVVTNALRLRRFKGAVIPA